MMSINGKTKLRWYFKNYKVRKAPIISSMESTSFTMVILHQKASKEIQFCFKAMYVLCLPSKNFNVSFHPYCPPNNDGNSIKTISSLEFSPNLKKKHIITNLKF